MSGSVPLPPISFSGVTTFFPGKVTLSRKGVWNRHNQAPLATLPLPKAPPQVPANWAKNVHSQTSCWPTDPRFVPTHFRIRMFSQEVAAVNSA